jgi:DNA-binding transcriptional ArsR family regulator
MQTGKFQARVARFADQFAAIGAEPRLGIIRLLLTAHPRGLIAGEIQEELGIPASTLSHHLEKLKNEDLIAVRREGTFLWYTARTETLQELLNFLYAECCTREPAGGKAKRVSIGSAPAHRNVRKPKGSEK